MISYRTLLFGTIAVVSAAAPAIPAQADSLMPVPLAIVRSSHSGGTSNAVRQQGPAASAITHSSFGTFLDTLVSFEEMVLRISL